MNVHNNGPVCRQSGAREPLGNVSIEYNARKIIEQFCGRDDGRSVALASGRDSRIVVGCRQHVPRPAASVIKVATVMALYDRAHAGSLDLDEQVAIKDLGETRYCSILKSFDQNRALSVREIAALSLITSDNPATQHVLSRITMDDVGRVLQGCRCSTHAVMAAGFSEPELGSPNRANVLTAEDAVRLFSQLQSSPRYAPVVTFLENNLRNARIPALLPEDVAIAHKTGSLDGVVNDAGIVSRGTTSFIVAFLCDAQADPIATQNEIAACALALFDTIDQDK